MAKKCVKYWKIGIIFFALMLFWGSGFIGHVLSARAATSSHFLAADTTPTTTPTPTPTTTPTPSPSPTPTTTPVPKPTPTPQQTPPPGILPPPPINATASPTATSTVTSTALPTLPTMTNDHPGQNIPPDHPGSGSNGGTPDVLMPLLAIGTPALVLSGGLLFWFYLRRNKSGLAALQKGYMSGATNTPWTNTSYGATGNGFMPVLDSFTEAMPYSAPPPYTTGPTLSANENFVPGANMLQQSISPSPAELAGPLYGSSDLRPMTMAFPTQAINQQAADLVPYQPTSNMNSFPLDTSALPQNGTRPMATEHMPDKLVSAIIPENPTPTLENFSLATPMQNTPMSADPATLSIQPPDVASDPMLEKVMRQAQPGLFVIPGREEI